VKRLFVALAALSVVSACGDPLADIDRVSELTEPLPEERAAALPDESEFADRPPFLSGLFRGGAPQSVPREDIELALFDAGVSPDGEVAPAPVRDPVPIDDAAAVPDVGTPPAQEPRGMLAWLRRSASTPDTSDMPEPTQVARVPEDGTGPQGAQPDEPVPQTEAASEMAQPAPRQGLFARLRGGARPASETPMTDAAPDGAIAFGTVERACHVKRAGLGKRVDQAPSGFALYDSAPGSETARPFFITGFSDGCPRQLTAALAMFGTPQLHEQLRYGLPADDFPYSDTDEAYEKVKRRICGVARGKPCGSLVSKIDNTTVFVSAYEKTEDNARWTDLLLHDGAVMAVALKSP